ncbi:g4476 [Coccomyxa elongata]
MRGLMQDHPLLVTNILDYAAKWHGEQVVVSRMVEGPILRTTYREIHERARLCALALQRLGVKEDDRVGTLAWNTSRHVEAWYGIMGLGAICHTLNPRLFLADLEYIANHAEDSVLMFDVDLVDLVAKLAPKLHTVKTYIVLTDRGNMHRAEAAGLQGALCYEELLEAERPRLNSFQWVRLDENAACGLCYTSGTTGRPKGVLYSHRANFLHAFTVAMPDASCMTSATSVLAVVPAFHANCWGLLFSAPLVGAKLVMPGPLLDGASLYQLLEEERCTLSAAVPTVFLGLLQYLRDTNQRLTHLKCITIGGAACPPLLIQAFQEDYGVEMRHMWGMTELCPIGSVAGFKGTLPPLSKEERLALQLKQGRVTPFVDMRIVDDDGRELPHDGKAYGELQVRGPHVIQRYYRHKEDAVDSEKWFNTGDVATLDPFGHMQITDRSKDVIKSGGEWISSIEVENIAISHPKVVEAAVIGIPDKKWTERPLLIAVPKKGQQLSSDELLSFFQDKIAKWWIPDDVVFVEELPHTATGKLSKLTLRQQFKGYVPKRSRL